MVSQLQVLSVGGPYQIVQVDCPVPKENEVLIRLKAIGLNPIDWKQHAFGYNVSSWPAVLGSDGAGIVESVGSSVETFSKGDEVLARFDPASSSSSASFQEFAVIPATHVARKPKSLSFVDAASIPVGFMTAASTVYQALEISLPFLKDGRREGNAPKSVLVSGGSSSVGAATVQLLHLVLPDAVILATSSPSHHDRLKSHGATAAFDYRSPDIVGQIRRASPEGAGVEAIVDTVGGVAINPDLLQTLTFPKIFAELVTGKSASNIPSDIKHTLVFGRKVLTAPGGGNLFAALGELLEVGRYELPIAAVITGQGLKDVEPGLARLKAGVSGTKLVVELSDDSLEMDLATG